MGGAGVHHASPERCGEWVPELRDVAWAQPVVATGSTQVGIALLASGDEIAWEIYSQDSGEAIVHCQGRAVWSVQAGPARLDLERIGRETRQGGLDANTVDAVYAR